MNGHSQGVVSAIAYCCSRPHSLVKLPRSAGRMLTHDHQMRAGLSKQLPRPGIQAGQGQLTGRSRVYAT